MGFIPSEMGKEGETRLREMLGLGSVRGERWGEKVRVEVGLVPMRGERTKEWDPVRFRVGLVPLTEERRKITHGRKRRRGDGALIRYIGRDQAHLWGRRK